MQATANKKTKKMCPIWNKQSFQLLKEPNSLKLVFCKLSDICNHASTELFSHTDKELFTAENVCISKHPVYIALIRLKRFFLKTTF